MSWQVPSEAPRIAVRKILAVYNPLSGVRIGASVVMTHVAPFWRERGIEVCDGGELAAATLSLPRRARFLD